MCTHPSLSGYNIIYCKQTQRTVYMYSESITHHSPMIMIELISLHTHDTDTIVIPACEKHI